MAVQVPQIFIHLASEAPIATEPPSPYAWADTEESNEDNFRPHYLSPPLATSPRFVRQQSPLAPSKPIGQGLNQAEFDALLRSSRERNSVSKKPQDLRREVAIKAHKSKQIERRALFLSKIAQPPSPSATSTPKTPPESPSIFHYTLPSPGLVSPLAHFESLSADRNCPLAAERKKWIEQVDFRLATKEPKPRRSALPSLDQISARLNAQREREQVAFPTIPIITVDEPAKECQQQNTRLPAFLQQSRPVIARTSSDPSTRPRLSIGNVGRLQMPVRPATTTPIIRHAPPKTPTAPELQVTTLVVPFPSTASPVELSEYNLLAMGSREKRSVDMLSRLKRRSTITNAIGTELSAILNLEDGFDGGKLEQASTVGRTARWKRHSAPADFQPHLYKNSHPVLSMPGGF